MKNTQMVPLERITLNGGIQIRGDIDLEVVRDYAEAMQRGDKFPPVVLYHDGERLLPADGHHRIHAAMKIGAVAVCAEIRSGDARAAFLHGVAGNQEHGLRLTRGDRVRAMKRMLEDPEWSQWSNRDIARRCGLDEKTVRRARAICGKAADDTRKVRRSNSVYTMDTSGIGGPGASTSTQPPGPAECTDTSPPEGTTETAAPMHLSPGDRVRDTRTGYTGTIEAVNGQRAVVRMVLPLAQLEPEV